MTMSENYIKPADVSIGDLVYYIRKHENILDVSFGTISEIYPSVVCLQLYDFVDLRMINGIPIKDFETPTRWQKLPKGWSEDTNFFDITFSKPLQDLKNYDIKNPNDILRAIKEGIYVKVDSKDYAYFTVDIDRNKGWRIRREYTPHEKHINSISLNYHQIYKSYDEALKAICEYKSELKRQSELSEYDWSVEKIDEELDKFAYFNNITEEDKHQYRDYLLSLNRVEDVQVRIAGKNLQWKYWQNSRWKNIELI